MSNRDDYLNLLTAFSVAVAARVPLMLWGAPGQGKTAVIESAEHQGWHVQTVIVSHYEPADFAGLPVVRPDGTVSFAPPSWAQRLAAHDGPSIGFFDEFSCAPPSTQAAALRPLTHYTVGALQLPPTVSWVAAANPADVAAAGWELAPPTANRFVHLDWTMPIDVYCESLVAGSWPELRMLSIPADYPARLAGARATVAGYLQARQSQLTALPSDPASRAKAWPSPRTWDYLSRLVALAQAVDAHPDVIRLLVHGAVGAPTGHEYLTFLAAAELVDPEQVLADPAASVFVGLRPDRVYVVLQSVLAAVCARPSPQRWQAAVEACAAAAGAGHVDAAVPVVRALLRENVRPAGAVIPAAIKVFAGPLALAGLLSAPAA